MVTQSEDAQGTCAVWPLFWFSPTWKHDIYAFPHGVALRKPGQRAAESMLEALKGWCDMWWNFRDCLGSEEFDEAWGCCPIWYESPLPRAEDEVEWFLCVDIGDSAQEAPVSEIGVDFRSELEAATAHAFVDALRILRKAPVLAPIRFTAGRVAGGPDFRSLRFDGNFAALQVENPDRVPSAELSEEHVKTLDLVWKRYAKLRSLSSWRKLAVTEQFFSRLDKEVGALRQKPVELWGEYFKDTWGVTIPLPQLRAIVGVLETEYDPPLIDTPEGRERYRRLFTRRFREVETDAADNASRIGRAASVFIQALALPPLHRFLSMCIVLETLFNTGQKSLGLTIPDRLSKLLTRDCETRQRLDERGLRVYSGRSDLVHGRRRYSEMPWNVHAWATDLARRSILDVLCDKDRFALFSRTDAREAVDVHAFLENLP